MNNPATKLFDSYSGQIEVLTSRYLVNKCQNNTSNSANQCQEESVDCVCVQVLYHRFVLQRTLIKRINND